MSPKISARARERYRLSASKSDTFDAFVLADTVRHEHARWRPLSHPSPLTAQLQAMSRDRARVLRAKVACESRLQLRKIIKNRGHFPNDDAVIKLLWLAIRDIEDKRARQRAKQKGRPKNERTAPGKLVEGAIVQGWTPALNALAIAYRTDCPSSSEQLETATYTQKT